MFLTIALLFLLRIGLPVLVLISIGVCIDRWQQKEVAK